ncbi:MAG: TrmB family transcriptional regulator [Candidatus Bathyarchaeia archaeon]|jgi:sugar-specific transcriptional regulator TrmB
MEIEDAIQTLVNLGLTVLQAKVYLALITIGPATGRVTAKTANVASQDVYRILTELQEKGLVEKIIAKPNRYKPTSIKDGVAHLLKQKAEEQNENEQKAEELVDNFTRNNLENTTLNESEFVMITTKDANTRRVNEGANRTMRNVDVIDSWDSFKYCILVYAEQIEKGAKRNVKFRYITDKPKKGEATPKIFQTWKKKGWAELRHIPTQPPTSIRIEDGKQVTLCIAPAAKHSLEAPSLFSDNPCLVATLQKYFEVLWNKASKDNTELPKKTTIKSERENYLLPLQ